MLKLYILLKGEFSIAEVLIMIEKYVFYYSKNEMTVSMKIWQSHTLKKSCAISK